MTHRLNMHKILTDDLYTEQNSDRNAEDSTTSAAQDQNRNNFINGNDPDILAMPVLTFEKPDVFSQLKKSSQLGENWHLISKDILSPLGIKHRAVIKHKIESAKKKKRNFTTSAAVEKELRKKITETQEIMKNKTKSQMTEMKRRVTWFARSNGPRMSVMIPFGLVSFEQLSPTRKPLETPIEIPLKKNYKTAGEVLIQQLLNMSWDQPPVASLWETLEAEENDRGKTLSKRSSSPSKRMISSRKNSPRDTKASHARRKSCECLQCGGISHLELRTSHIFSEAVKPENTKISQNVLGVLQDIKRESMQVMKGFNGRANALGLKSGRGLFQNGSVSAIPTRKRSNRSSIISEEENLEKMVLRLHEANVERSFIAKDEESKSSKRMSRIFDGTPLQSPGNEALRVRENVAQGIVDNLPDQIVTSQKSSITGFDAETETHKTLKSLKIEERGQAKENLRAEILLVPVKLKQPGDIQPQRIENKLKPQRQRSLEKREVSTLKEQGLFDILQERYEESPKLRDSLRARNSKKSSANTFSMMSTLLNPPGASNTKLSDANPLGNRGKIRSLNRTQASFAQLDSALEPLQKNSQQPGMSASKQSHPDPRAKLKIFLTPKRMRTEMTSVRRLSGPSVENKTTVLETQENIPEENKDDLLMPVSLNLNKNEDILKAYHTTSLMLKQPLSRSYSQSPGRKFLQVSSQEMTLKMLQKANSREDSRLARLVNSRDQRINQMGLSQYGLNSSISHVDSKFKDSSTYEEDSRIETLPGTAHKSRSNFTSLLPDSVKIDVSHLPIINSHTSTAKALTTAYSNLMGKTAYSKIQKRIIDKDLLENRAQRKASLNLQATLSAQ